MLSMTACVTKTKIEYVYDVPDVEFPIFPEPNSVSLNEDEGTVEMPLWYWEKIAEYKFDVDAIEEYFERVKKIQERISNGNE